MKERKNTRLKGYDYSRNNLYFVTICVQDKICCFGEIKSAGTGGTGRDLSRQMILNKYGQIAQKQWYWLGEQYPYVVLHAFIIMPDHIHGIIEIDRSRSLNALLKIKSLSELMGAYKTTVSKQIHLIGLNEFQWQRSFHDHIIRDEKSYETISKYIVNNPVA